MNESNAIMIIGILKGIRVQTKDIDVEYALNQSIDVFTKLLQGYRLIEPEKGDRMDPNIDPATGKVLTEEDLTKEIKEEEK